MADPKITRIEVHEYTYTLDNLGTDYKVEQGALVFDRELRKDRISKWRWFLGAWGVGTYRQDDSVDVRYERADGTPAVAEKLDIELRP